MRNVFVKVFGTSALAAGVVLISALSASAGTLIGIYNGNDSPGPIEYEGVTYDFFGKFEVDEDAFTGTEFLIDLGQLDEGEAKGGTASVTNGGAGLFSVKAGNGYALYYTNDLSSITWNTTDLNNKGLSHLSVWAGNPNPVSESVPEPASLLGLAAVGAIAARGALKKKATA